MCFDIFSYAVLRVLLCRLLLCFVQPPVLNRLRKAVRMQTLSALLQVPSSLRFPLCLAVLDWDGGSRNERYKSSSASTSSCAARSAVAAGRLSSQK